MKVALYTLGCRVNSYESEAMAEKFIKEGYEVVSFDEFSDVYVINTCTVTNMGDKKSRQMIGRARRHNPEAIIAVVGCYSQIASDEIAQIEGVDVVLGSRNKGDIVYWVNRAREESKQVVEVKDVLKNNKFEQLAINEYQDKTRAFLKIQDGCNRFCSYCLIPFARGGVCSKEPEEILKEVKELSKNGFKEIILSGVHTASYGVDLEGNWDLVKILEEINKIEGIERIRIGSIDPTFFTEGVIEKICKLEKMCPHFHLSLQSGCDATIRRMNRKYTAQEYKDVVENLRKYMKDVSITTDIIVGFPGETEEDFEDTLSLVKEVEYDSAFTFLYSRRGGTPADLMFDQVDEKVKKERFNRLVEVVNEISAKKNKLYDGKIVEVLVEGESKSDDTKLTGRTRTSKLVNFTGNKENIGKLVNVRITKANSFSLIGEEV